MHTNALDVAEVGVFTNNCRLPVHSLSTQTRHIVDSQSTQVRQSQRMLSLFVLVLCLAVATVLCLLIVNSPANAAPHPMAAQINASDGLIALAALVSLVASFAIGFGLIVNQLRPAFRRRNTANSR